MPRLRGLSIFAQTLLMLVASLIITQAVVIGVIIALPQPRPDFFSMSEIARTFSGAPAPTHGHGRRDTYTPPPTTVQPSAPVRGPGMTENAGLSADLANRLSVTPARVRLFFKPDQSGFFPFARREPGEVVPMRRGDALFFNTVVAAFDTGAGWRVLQSPERPLINDWQRRTILLFGISLLVLLAIAWLFARRLSRPIRRFAESADRLGRDSAAPPVPVEGPAEMRTAAHALNAMQGRIADYLRERTAMMGAIAHDLRTPLARIAFRIENASDAIRDPVQNDIEQMSAMIAATMDFMKGSGQPQARVTVNLGPLLSGMIERERGVGHDVQLAQTDDATVTGDPVALQRMVQNLIDNALAFGGSATVSLNASPGEATVSIADAGSGLPPDMLETVFDPFVRVDPSRNRSTGGVGLGLTIARAIAQDHGGALTLANREGSGLVATVVLPMVANSPTGSSESTSS
jgi:two-component system, OmpR family, sensor kinase